MKCEACKMGPAVTSRGAANLCGPCDDLLSSRFVGCGRKRTCSTCSSQAAMTDAGAFPVVHYCGGCSLRAAKGHESTQGTPDTLRSRERGSQARQLDDQLSDAMAFL